MAFKPHMTFLEASKLKKGDQLDHRHRSGYYYVATIVSKTNQLMYIKYHGVSEKHNTVCSFVTDLCRFATVGSISRRPAHRLTNIKQGSFVDINVKENPGWRRAEVIELAAHSGQIRVQYLHDVSDGIHKPIKMHTWVHLDNPAEVDVYGSHTLQSLAVRDNHIPVSLETKRLYSNTPDELKEACAADIIENVLGGMSNALSLLIQNASTSQLIQMKQIIKQKNNKYQETKNNEIEKESISAISQNINENESNKISEQPVLKVTSSLSQISSDCVKNICGYLGRKDIKYFKLTSFRNAIVCLTEMTKCNFSIFNTNDIINDKNRQYIDKLGLFIKDYNFCRYPANMVFLSLRQIWSEQYDIPMQHQLFYAFSGLKVATYLPNSNGKYSIDNQPIKWLPVRNFTSLDMRNVITFDKLTDKPEAMKNHYNQKRCAAELTLIKWYDIYFQEIMPIQFVVGDFEKLTIGRITKYIEHEFVATTQQQMVWRAKLMTYFKRMDSISQHHQKLIIFKEIPGKMLSACNNPISPVQCWDVYIIQLNTAHPAFAKKKFTTIQQTYHLFK